MFKLNDRVIVLSDWESNNCKDKIGTIVNAHGSNGNTVRIRFDSGQGVKYSDWWVVRRLVKKLDEPIDKGGEY